MSHQQRRTNPELPDSVREALDALRPVPPVAPSTWEEGRQAFLAQARAMRPAEAERAVAPGGPLGALRELFGFSRRGASPLALALKAVFVLALLFAGSVGTVGAARASLPGSVLYPLKVRLEAWDLSQAHTPEDVARQALEHAQVRVDEAQRLAGRGDDVPYEVAQRYQEGLALALEASGSLDEPLRLKTRDAISETLRHQLRTMVQLSARVEGDAQSEDDTSVRAMIRTMEWTQAQIGQGGNGQPAGPVQQGPAGEPAGPAGACEGESCEDAPNGPAAPNGPGEPGDGQNPATGPGPGEGEPQDGGNGPGPGKPPGEDGEGPHQNGPDRGDDEDRGKGGTQGEAGGDDNAGRSTGRIGDAAPGAADAPLQGPDAETPARDMTPVVAGGTAEPEGEANPAAEPPVAAGQPADQAGGTLGDGHSVGAFPVPPAQGDGD